MKSIYPAVLFLVVTAIGPLAARPQFEATSPEHRQASASHYLRGQVNQIAVYTKGLVCSSCGIGLRVHLKKLKGIDKALFNKGIHIDASKQLIVIAYQVGAQPNPEAIHKAIENAGYEAAHYYLWDGKQVGIHYFGGGK